VSAQHAASCKSGYSRRLGGSWLKNSTLKKANLDYSSTRHICFAINDIQAGPIPVQPVRTARPKPRSSFATGRPQRPRRGSWWERPARIGLVELLS
jgi:hypothetical protein